MRRVKGLSESRETLGFTLIELIFVLVIASVILISIVTIYSSFIDTYRLYLTRQRMEEIETSIRQYVSIIGRLPCVAPVTAMAGDPDFGQALDCAVAADNLTSFSTPGRAGLNVRIGGIPHAELTDVTGLKISSQHSYDGWGRRLSYAVTEIMAESDDGFRENKGSISIIDTAGNSLTAYDPETAVYAIVSHGEDGTGAPFGVPCPTASLDAENCDYWSLADRDHIFRYSLIRSSSGGASQYDDFVNFSTKDLVSSALISSFVFEEMSCTDPASPAGTIFGEACATVTTTLACDPPGCNSYGNIRVDAGAGETSETHGRLLHQTDFTALNSGVAYVRATIAVRIWQPFGWDPPILADIYLDNLTTGTLVDVQRAEIYNPTYVGNSHGGTGVILGRFPINRDHDYRARIYVYHTCMTSCGSSGSHLWIGTVRLGDHYVTGTVEVMQMQNN